MDIVTQYTIPTLHPLLVHFPLVLILLAAGAACVWLIDPDPKWLRAGIGLHALGLLAAVLALRTGEALAEDVGETGLTGQLISLHETGAWVTIWTSLAAILLAVVVLRRERHVTHRAFPPVVTRVAVVLIALVAAAAVAWTAHLGGLMVWGVAR